MVISWVKGTDFSCKMLDIRRNKIKTNTWSLVNTKRHFVGAPFRYLNTISLTLYYIKK